MSESVSSSWLTLSDELRQKCPEDVSPSEITDWILSAIENINAERFHYYITAGPTPEFKDMRVDVTIFFHNCLHGFSKLESKKSHFIYPIKNVVAYAETEEKGFFSINFYSQIGESGFLIEEKIQNAARLSEFGRRILDGLWEMR